MVEVLLDTAYLACPVDGPEESKREFLDRLASLSDLSLGERVRLVRSGRVWEVLAECASMPPFGPSDFDRYVQPGDLIALFGGVLDRSVPVEDRTGIRDILVDDVDYAVPRRSPPGFDADLFRLVALWATRLPDGACMPLLADLGRDGHTEFRALIIDTDPPIPNTNVVSCTCHVSALTQIGFCVQAEDLLLAGDFVGAVLHESARRNGTAWIEEPQTFAIHPAFIESAREWGFLSDRSLARRLIRASVDVVTGERLEKTHSIRTSSSGSAPQVVRVRDGANAWRMDIDYEFHLHYWRAGSATEFAIVSKHAECAIPD